MGPNLWIGQKGAKCVALYSLAGSTPLWLFTEGANHRLISCDRLTKYDVFFKILTNFPFPFCFAALSFLTNGMGGGEGGVFVDYSL